MSAGSGAPSVAKTAAHIGAVMMSAWMAFGPARAAAGDVACLWDALSPSAQLRLELAVKTKGQFDSADIQSVGAERLVGVIRFCGYEPNQASYALLARYWATRASVAALTATLRGWEVDLPAADKALERAVPTKIRAALAAEISASNGAAPAGGPASLAIQTAVETLEVQGPLLPPARRTLIEYYVARILADGFATPP
ncbi:MAG: hypothetical protein KTR21_08730 [Rhodobacteraceae bacterium]|nr:hypothetical protein [Paracoccaceae bacterium]